MIIMRHLGSNPVDVELGLNFGEPNAGVLCKIRWKVWRCCRHDKDFFRGIMKPHCRSRRWERPLVVVSRVNISEEIRRLPTSTNYGKIKEVCIVHARADIPAS